MTMLADLLQTRRALSKKGLLAKKQTFECFCTSAIYRPSNFHVTVSLSSYAPPLLYYFSSVDFWRQSRCGVFAATVSSLTVMPAIKLIFTRIWLNTTATP